MKDWRHISSSSSSGPEVRNRDAQSRLVSEKLGNMKRAGTELPPVPRRGNVRGLKAIFENEARLIRRGFHDRVKRQVRSKSDGSRMFLKRAAYRLIRHFLAAGRSDILEQIVLEHRRKPNSRAPRLADNPFHWGLLAIGAPVPDKNFISSTTRSIMAAQLCHAASCDVPNEMLVAFILQLDVPEKEMPALVKRNLT